MLFAAMCSYLLISLLSLRIGWWYGLLVAEPVTVWYGWVHNAGKGWYATALMFTVYYIACLLRYT